MAFTDEQQNAIDNLTSEQRVAIETKRALLIAEDALVEGKTRTEDEALRDAKLLLRTQRQAFREGYRATVISFEQRYNLMVTKDGFEPTQNPTVYVNGR